MKKKLEKILGFEVEATDNRLFGDYTANVAMVRAKAEKKNPRELAAEIAAKLDGDKKLKEFVEKIDIAGPGFINFWLKSDVLVDNLIQISKEKENYGKGDLISGQKTVVEYTDPNPFKEFHVGHLYTNTVGESLARLLESQGAIVWRADYFGDVGMHVAKAIWGLLAKLKEDGLKFEELAQKSLKERIEYFGKAYSKGATAYEEDKNSVEEMKQLNFLIFKASQEVVLPAFKEKANVDYDRFIDAGNKYDYQEIKNIYNVGRTWSLEYFETIYARVGMKFDGYYPESRTGEFGYGMVLEALGKGIFEKGEGGAIIFPGEKYGLHNRVFINSLGLPTYETKDFGNAVAKYKDFPYDKSLIVTGNEINAYFKVVLLALSKVNPKLSEATTHLGHGMVRLPEGKMSSRTGKIIKGEWVIDEAKRRLTEQHQMDDNTAEVVAQASVKYAFLKSAIGGDIAFDFDTSLSFDGNSGPYLQYTVARCNSVLIKAKAKDTELMREIKNNALGEAELKLMRVLMHFGDTVNASAQNYAPNILCNYLYDLAKEFNGFYNVQKIIGSDSEKLRLELTFGTMQILKNGLKLLGISAPEKM